VFCFIRAERANHPVAMLCRVLEVSRQGFYAWLSRPACARERFDCELRRRIRRIHAGAGSRSSYGSPRIWAQLRREGVRVSRKRIERLMGEAGLRGRPRRRRRRGTTTRVPGVRPAPDLVCRDFNPAQPNRLWCADLTEIPTAEGKLYLAGVIDCFSRAAVGWSMASRMPAELVVDALDRVLPLLPPEFRTENWLGVHIPGMGVAFTVLIVFATGVLAANIIGQRLVVFWEGMLARIPVVNSISLIAGVLSGSAIATVNCLPMSETGTTW
jgi:hypothetical protein